jgi:F0F1-type ATP synthase assembly protein I
MEAKPPQNNLLRYATVGLEFFLVFLAFFVGGWLIDWRLGTSPGFTVLGGITGFGVAYYRITRQGWGILKSSQRDRDRNRDRDRGRGRGDEMD